MNSEQYILKVGDCITIKTMPHYWSSGREDYDLLCPSEGDIEFPLNGMVRVVNYSGRPDHSDAYFGVEIDGLIYGFHTISTEYVLNKESIVKRLLDEVDGM